MDSSTLKVEIFSLFKENPGMVISPGYVYTTLQSDRDTTYKTIYELAESNIIKKVGLGQFILADSTDIKGYLKVDNVVPVVARMKEVQEVFGYDWFTTDEIMEKVLEINPGYPARDRKQYGDALNRMRNYGTVVKKKDKWRFVPPIPILAHPTAPTVIAEEPRRIAAKTSDKLFEFLQKLPDDSLLLRDEDGSLFVAEPVEEVISYRTKTRVTLGKVGRE